MLIRQGWILRGHSHIHDEPFIGLGLVHFSPVVVTCPDNVAPTGHSPIHDEPLVLVTCPEDTFVRHVSPSSASYTLSASQKG